MSTRKTSGKSVKRESASGKSARKSKKGGLPPFNPDRSLITYLEKAQGRYAKKK